MVSDRQHGDGRPARRAVPFLSELVAAPMSAVRASVPSLSQDQGVIGEGALVDRATQLWVRATGRRVALADHPWLVGPVGDPCVIGDEWVAREATRLGGDVVDGGGLLSSMSVLDGPGFCSADLSAPIRDFYEHTDEWRLEVWSQWCPAAWPFGWLLSWVFSRRLQQLALPLRPLDAAQGIDSQVVSARDPNGQPIGAAWLRRLRATGAFIYSGWYGSCTLPDAQGPSVRVAFPLPNGSVTVFLGPESCSDGSLKLVSNSGGFGQDGCYLLVTSPDLQSAWVRRVPIGENFRVYVDSEGVLRTDHELRLGRIPVIRFHYRLQRRTA